MATKCFMDSLRAVDKTTFIKRTYYILKEYGASLPCNRFAIGNTIELFFVDVVRDTGRNAVSNMEAKRIDVTVDGLEPFSIKYSTSGNIKLHNSLGENRDRTMVNTLLITPDQWWFLDIASMAEHGVDYKVFLKDVADGLELKRSILAELKTKQYPHVIAVDLGLKDENKCKNRSTAELLYADACSAVSK